MTKYTKQGKKTGQKSPMTGSFGVCFCVGLEHYCGGFVPAGGAGRWALSPSGYEIVGL